MSGVRPVLPGPYRPRRSIPARWFRAFVGFADHPKWRRIARDANVPAVLVVATVQKLLETANTGEPRGSVANFSPEEWALSIGAERSAVDRVWRALEEVGFIDREYLPKWDTWQPDKEDPTHAARQARYREKRRVERQRPAGDGVTSVTVTGVTASPVQVAGTSSILRPYSAAGDGVTSVTVTPRAEQKVIGPSGEGREWLYGDFEGSGLVLVMRALERGSENFARFQIKNWLDALNQDAELLARIIRAVDGQAKGADYERLVTQHVATARAQAAGAPQLPLGPTAVASNG